ncbi:MAG: interleukin-like EMT inducer domain-containing protein, partial [Caldilineales bacterium]
ADLVGMLTPTALHPIFGDDREPPGAGWVASLRAVETGDSPFADINTVFVGWVTLALAVLGAIAGGRRSRAWTGIALVAGVLALGPLLQIKGQSVFDLDGLAVNLPLPYIILHYLPFIKGFRAPNRFSIDLMQALAVLAGFGAAWLLGKVAGGGRERKETEETRELRDGETTPSTLHPPPSTSLAPRSTLAAVLAVVLAAGVIFEHLAVPLPLTDSRVPEPYREIAQQPGNFALLQLPMGWRNGFGVFGTEDTRVQWYQTVHDRPILGGNTSRNPAFKFEYFERLPLLQAITAIEAYGQPDDATDTAARASAAELMALWNVGYVVVNSPVPERYPYVDTWEASRDYVLDVVPVDPQPVWNADGVQVYKVQQPPVPFPYELDLGSRNTDAWRGPGWSSDETDIAGASGAWIDDTTAEVFLPLRFASPQPIQLSLRLQPFIYEGAPQQTVRAEFNGVDLGRQALAGGWQEISFAVPAGATQSGLNRVRLHFAGTARPADVLPGQAAVGSTGVQSPVDIEINSGGAAQDIAFITVTPPDGDPQDASAGRRGYNLTAIDPKSGDVLDMRGFDTWANEFEADDLAAFVEGLPDGTIVVGAARDDASRFLNDRAVAALASLGSAVDLRSTPGYGHALVGVKGAPAGAAAEAAGPDGAYLRLAADRRPLAAAVDWIRLEPAP